MADRYLVWGLVSIVAVLSITAVTLVVSLFVLLGRGAMS
jgi:hypothetical protein